MSKKVIIDTKAYREVLKGRGDVPVFFQSWWLDTVCVDGRWEALLYYQDPDYVAIWPYFLKRKGPFMYITMPLLTKFMGPYFLEPLSHDKEHRLLSRMAKVFPATDGCAQATHYQLSNVLPLQWQGFDQSVQYSYVIEDIRNLDEVWKNINADYRRNKIPKAEQQLKVNIGLEAEQLHQILQVPFDRQKLVMPYSLELLKALVTTTRERGCGQSFYAVSDDGEVQAVTYLVWDDRSCYLLLAGETERGRTNAAGLYTIWKSIEFASVQLSVGSFDFLGSVIPSIEPTRRKFGAQQRPYFLLRRDKALFRWLKRLRLSRHNS